MKSIIRRSAIITIASLALVNAPFTTPAHAAISVVAVALRADDGSANSLRGTISAINFAGGEWIVELQPGAPYVIDRQCQQGNLDDNHGGDLDITTNGDVTFAAPEGTVATIEVRCAGERIIDHLGVGSVRFDRIRLTGGNTANGANGIQAGDRDAMPGGAGGAIRSEGTVHLVSSIIENNSTGNGGNGAPSLVPAAGGRGGEGGSGSAVIAETIVAFGSVIRNNHTGNGGNGANGATMPGGRGGGGGGATLGAETVTLIETQVEANTNGNGGNGGSGQPGGDGGFGGRGGGVAAAHLELHNSTIANNLTGNGGRGGNGSVPAAAGGDGGGAGSGGGSISDGGRISNSTVHGNVTGIVGAPGTGTPNGTSIFIGHGGGVLFSSGQNANLIASSTITANSAAIGANLDVFNTTVRYSIIGEGNGASSCRAPVIVGSYAVFDDASCGPSDFVFGSFGLGPLTDNGGATSTRLPSPASPVVELIPADVCSLIEGVDQRRESRPNGLCEPGSVELPPLDASMFVPLPPQRVFDTREPGPTAGYVGANSTRTVQFAGVAGIPPSGATAVAFNLTIDSAAGEGFVTAYEAGQPRPLASSLNTVRPGQVVPNMVIVPLSPAGQIDFYAQAGGHLIGDVLGYFVATPIASAGRIIPLSPARLFDTREPGPTQGKVPAGGQLTIDVTGIGGVPPNGVAAIVVNVTATEADGRGYVTVHPGTQPRPLASTLNLDGPGHTAANLTIVPVGTDGTITLFSQSGAHLLADVTGYVTDGTARLTSYGLMVPIAPLRLFDTRVDGTPVAAGGTIERSAVRGVILDDAAAVILNLTATEAAAPGYVTGYPVGIAQPLASTLNLTQVGETRPNAAILPVGEDGEIAYFSQSGTHLLADAFGYLLAEPPPFAIVF